jgi:hypothetical protein
MNTSRCKVPFDIKSIMYLRTEAVKLGEDYGVVADTYLVLCQDEDHKAKEDMEVIVRSAISTKDGWKFEEMNKGANRQL